MGDHVHYTIKHIIETDLDTFWKLFFDDEFNKTLYDHLGFTTWRVIESRKDPDGVIHRRVDCTPKIELPAAARKILGSTAGYTEIGRFDPKLRKYSVDVQPHVAADKIKTKTEITAEALPDANGKKRVERIVHTDTTVKVFGLGSILEGFIEQQTRDLYAKAADFQNRYMREKGL